LRNADPGTLPGMPRTPSSHDLRTPPPPADELAREVAHELVRAFVAIGERRRSLIAGAPAATPGVVLQQLIESIAASLQDYAVVYADDVHNDLLILLPEAIDNLGCPLEAPPIS
jgi:hypothetical protein